MIIGLAKTKEKYANLATESKTDIIAVLQNDSISNKDSIHNKKESFKQEKVDSIIKNLDAELRNSLLPIPEKTIQKIVAEAKINTKDATNIEEEYDGTTFKFGGATRIDDFSEYAKKHPDSKIDAALDSLDYEKNFTNRFLFTKAKSLYALTKNKESSDQFFSQVLSYGSIALFIFLPFFTLFIKLFYIRRKYTYIDHLIFVFHIQTVFFMLFSIFLILKVCNWDPKIGVFMLLFLLYLIIALKKFYQQGYFKTIVKFLLINMSYVIVSSIGVVFLFIISFMLF